jgi:hypothetical protein
MPKASAGGKLENARESEPPTRIIPRIYETPGVTAERLISREERGNLVVETYEGPDSRAARAP